MKRPFLWGALPLVGALAVLGQVHLAAAGAGGPRWSAQLSSTAYISQSQLPVANEDQTSVVQTFSLQSTGWWKGKLSANLSGRLADDLRADREVYEPARMYTGYLRLKLRARRTEARLGRQYLHEGSSWLNFDGLHLSTRLTERVELRAWAGAQSRLHMDFQFGDPSKRGAFGARIVGRLGPGVDASLWWARTDRCDGVIRQPVGGEVGWRRSRQLSLRIRGSYETERSEFERMEFLGRWTPSARGTVLAVQYLDRRPQLETGSWFQRFSQYISRVRLARETFTRRSPRGFGGEVQALQSFTEEQSSGEFGFALLAPHLRLGYARTYGDRATGDRIYGSLRFQPRRWWQLRAGAVASQYELLANAPSSEEREVVSSYLRSSFDLRESVRLTAEVQTVDRPFNSGDLRLLIGLDLRGQASFAPLSGEG